MSKQRKMKVSAKAKKKIAKMFRELDAHLEHSRRTKTQYRPCS
jgi:hypothetical protein